MRSWLPATRRFSHALPEALAGEDIRLSESVLEALIGQYSVPGDVVIDPFAGFGTALVVAERLGRSGWGIERRADLCAYARGLLAAPERMICADVRSADLAGLPAFALSVASPIYMHSHESRDPLSGFAEAGGYDDYLAALAGIYRRLADRAAPGAAILVEAANLRSDEGTTPFAWDLARALGGVLRFEREIVLAWERYGYGAEHSHVLVFRPPAGAQRSAGGRTERPA